MIYNFIKAENVLYVLWYDVLCYVLTKTLLFLRTGAGNPLTDGIFPILTIDVWEHGKSRKLCCISYLNESCF